MKNWENDVKKLGENSNVIEYDLWIMEEKMGNVFVKFILFLKLRRIFKHKSFGQNYYNIEKKIHRYWGEKGYKYTITNT